MILETVVQIRWNSNNKSYYTAKGYVYSSMNQPFDVSVADLPKWSKAPITAVCDDCGKHRQLRYHDYSDRCYGCNQEALKRDPVIREMKARNTRRINNTPELLAKKLEGARAMTGPKHPNWNPNRTRDQREKERKTPPHVEWARLVKERDAYTCQVCDQWGRSLVSHHLMAYANFPDLRLDVTNGVTLCARCHKAFHKRYGKGDNTREQFEEFKRECKNRSGS
ncbi:hypothetical protein D3C86_683690 [compost metagenome]